MNYISVARDVLAKVAKDWFTGLDGESYAIGKALAVFIAVSGGALPYVMILMKQAVSLTEAGLFYGGLGGSVMALVWGTNPAEPKPSEPSP